ncbi:MAG TPA: RNA polymerase sigma factor [Terriglobales bacterium]|nr:RNA polymerase sigma factor [Terriglobales bacterium]
MTTPIPAGLTALADGAHISELDDVAELMRLYQAKIFRFVAFSIRDFDAAETITQDCFLKAHNTRHQFRGDCSVSTWLMRIAFNLVRDHTKTLKFRFWKNVQTTAINVDELGHYLPSGASSPEAQFLARERVELIQSTLGRLSEKQRSIFLMKFVEDLDLSEIAEIMAMPLQTVKTHLYRAVATIRDKFGATL